MDRIPTAPARAKSPSFPCRTKPLCAIAPGWKTICRKVTELSGGKLAYVYLPNTGAGGFTNFNRYYFAQLGKQGAVIDERFNAGGQAADYIIQYMQRKIWNYWTAARRRRLFRRRSAEFTVPRSMITNEFAGSGGDALPWYFRHVGLGPLVGKRTWGGLVGIGGYPSLIDGGFVTAPRFAFFTTEGNWEVENHGVAPDIDIEMEPAAWRQGHDTQLEKSIEVAMQELGEKSATADQAPGLPGLFQVLHRALARGHVRIDWRAVRSHSGRRAINAANSVAVYSPTL